MPDPVSFNLIDQSWVPCLRLGGKRLERLSLRETLAQAHALREIYTDSPLITAALYRLCLAVLHSAMRGPQGWREWNSIWERRETGFDMSRIDGYFSRAEIYQRFDLFGDKPFYQSRDPRLKTDKAAFLVMVGADANMPTLFDHRTERSAHPLPPAEAAWYVIAAQTFAVGLGRSDVGEQLTHGPWTSGITFLAAGESLFETLVLNMVSYAAQRSDSRFGYQSRRDKPAWEMEDAFAPEKREPFGYLDYLTWQSRRILLIPEATSDGIYVRTMRMAQGLKLPDDINDFMKRRYKQKRAKGEAAWQKVAYRLGKGVWRDSATLFQRSDSEDLDWYVVDWLAELAAPERGYLPRNRPYNLMAFGIATSEGRAASIEFARAERLPLRLEYLSNDELVDQLRQATIDAEKVGRALRYALKTLAIGLVRQTQPSASPKVKTKGKPKQPVEADDDDRLSALDKRDEMADPLMQSWDAEALYWSALETKFWTFVHRLADAKDDAEARNAALDDWRATLREKAQAAFEQAVELYAGSSPRALRSASEAQRMLWGSLKWAFGQRSHYTAKEDTA